MSDTLKTNEVKPKTAGIIVIGDEILNGQVQDTNSGFATPIFRQFGILTKKISVIGDDIEEICEEVKLFSGKYDYVITSGGIGPTHDDVTFEAVSKAFKEPLVLNQELYEICKHFYKINNENSPLTKEARIPKGSKLIFTEAETICGYFPLVNIQNVFMFPGIPNLFQSLFKKVCKDIFSSSVQFHTRTVYYKVGEDKIAEGLSKLNEECPNVKFGSYPVVMNKDYAVKVTMESLYPKCVEFAQSKLSNIFPKHYLTVPNNG